MIAYNVFCGSWNEFSCLQSSVAINQCQCRPRELCWFTPGKAAFAGVPWISWAFAVTAGVCPGPDCVPSPERKIHLLFPLGSSPMCFPAAPTLLTNNISSFKQRAYASGDPGTNTSLLLFIIILLSCLSSSFTAQANGFAFGMVKLDGSADKWWHQSCAPWRNSRVRQRKGSSVRNSRLCWQDHTSEEPGFAGWALCSGCNLFKERKARSVCESIWRKNVNPCQGARIWMTLAAVRIYCSHSTGNRNKELCSLQCQGKKVCVQYIGEMSRNSSP